MRFLLLLTVCCVHLSLAAEDLWFSGTLAGQPLATLHQSARTLPDGRNELTVEMLMVIKRSLPGQPEFRMVMRDTQVFVEGPDGTISGFRFDRDENGSISSAVGAVASDPASGETKVTGTLARLGRTTPILLTLKPGVRLLGDEASRKSLVELATAAGTVAGSQTKFTTLGLIGNQVAVITSTATWLATKGNQHNFNVLMDLMPLPMVMRLDRKGNLVGMTMNLGMMVMEFKPSDGPMALLGAELPPTGLVAKAGPPPGRGPINRLRIPAGPALPEDPFQREESGVVTLAAESAPNVLAPAARAQFLAPTGQLELDDPALRAWVDAAIGEGTEMQRAERLRLAVRSHITTKDLGKGDASALETFRTRQGDCTEHATLLAAALRIAGIPARIQVGLVYATDYGGWVGHAWNQAYIDDRWQHLDSAYPGIPRSCYLGLGFSDGLQTGAALMVQLNRFVGSTVTVLAE